MKTYLAEFENLVTDDPVIMVIHGETEEDCFNQAYEFSVKTDYVCTGGFDMYVMERHANGELYILPDWRLCQ